ncbi:emerin isoform X2 [Electrophorus electricus]|uniref:LEM domain-containing protein n=1 Tax=Electrophorus electricus TaxID=8005 RepID=A0A4W4FSD1_ELEEL|nr:emerin isoform X2 [Electrophorus electricus]
MATLSSKSNQELSQLLDEYGIKHGPVVGSTRSLYEKKLRDAMAKERKAKPSYYREEEEVTYINHRRPFGHGSYRDRSEYRDLDTTDEPIVIRTQTQQYSSTPQAWHAAPVYETQRKPAPKPTSARFVPVWLQILLFLIVAGFLVFIFINMESEDTDPFKKLA